VGGTTKAIEQAEVWEPVPLSTKVCCATSCCRTFGVTLRCRSVKRHCIRRTHLHNSHETNKDRAPPRDGAQPPHGKQTTAMNLMIWMVMGYWDGDGWGRMAWDGLRYTLPKVCT